MTRSSQHFAKRSLGQNFLVDQRYIRRIVDAVEAGPEDLVFEIGPGTGALTRPLLDEGADVIAIEKDDRFVESLSLELSSNEKFRIIGIDATEFDFISACKGRTAKLAANLPYNVSTLILQHLAVQRGAFSRLVLMLQREVVDRMVAPPGNSERGFLTVLVEAAFNVEKLFDVPPSAFRPRPKVTSSVARLLPRPLSETDRPEFRQLLSAAFTHKRKTLGNNLRGHYPEALRALEPAEIDPLQRAESLTLDAWQRLFSALC